MLIFGVLLPYLVGLQEPEVEICASMLDALNECIQVGIIKLRCIS